MFTETAEEASIKSKKNINHSCSDKSRYPKQDEKQLEYETATRIVEKMLEIDKSLPSSNT
jgi:hypothetical protein